MFRTISLLLMLSLSLFAQDKTAWLTYYEKSDFKRTPRYEETIAFCKRLADASPMVYYTGFGTSPQGRELPLLIVDKKGHFTPQEVKTSGNAIMLIQAGIHAGEIDGKDAGLTLIRDMVIYGKNQKLLDHVTILFIPIFNVDGHEHFGPYNRINQNGPLEMGWRVTAQNYNLNRDYLKADAPEMQAWLKLFTLWLPDFFVDCHVTDGADYQYTATYKIDTFGEMENNLVDWVKNIYLAQLKPAMSKSGFPIINYISFKKAHNPKSGMETGVFPPRFSDSYLPVQNRPGLLIETHMLKDYKTRVTGTYQMLKHSIEILNADYADLKEQVSLADALTSSEDFRNKPLPLTFKSTGDSTMIRFLGVKYDVVKSDLSGGDWYRFSKDTTSWLVPFFNKIVPDYSVILPRAYIIPVEWIDVIDRMKLHGIEIKRLSKATRLRVKSYRFSNVKWAERPYENHHPLVKFDIKDIEEEREFPAGSAVVFTNQRTAKVIAHILEPKAPDSYFYWGFFDSIFEVKEYAESYVMEEYARSMLNSDDSLKQEFETKLAADSSFAANPRAILFWFYQKSPYWDKRINIYPVGKIDDSKILGKLELQ